MALIPKIVHKPGNTRSPWTVRYEANGKQRERSFRLKSDAEAFRVKVDYETRARIFVDPDERTTVADYFETWIERHAVSPGTERLYRSTFKNQISPALGGKALGKVTREDVTALLLDGPLRDLPSAQSNARKVLLGMFGEALKQERVARNPAAGIRLPNGTSDRASWGRNGRSRSMPCTVAAYGSERR
jgi:hypothetical protein